jgi:hypothetical protein
VAIISIAQQARPNVTGPIDDFRAQLKTFSVADGVGDGGQRLGRLVVVGPVLPVLLELLKVLELRPHRRRHLGHRRLHFHSSTPSR